VSGPRTRAWQQQENSQNGYGVVVDAGHVLVAAAAICLCCHAFRVESIKTGSADKYI
jgi:hypothetical protein